MTNKTARKIAARSQFLIYLLFPLRLRCCACAELASSVTTQNYSWYATILPEKPTIWWKTRDEIDVRKYPYRLRPYCILSCHFQPFLRESGLHSLPATKERVGAPIKRLVTKSTIKQQNVYGDDWYDMSFKNFIQLENNLMTFSFMSKPYYYFWITLW